MGVQQSHQERQIHIQEQKQIKLKQKGKCQLMTISASGQQNQSQKQEGQKISKDSNNKEGRTSSSIDDDSDENIQQQFNGDNLIVNNLRIKKIIEEYIQLGDRDLVSTNREKLYSKSQNETNI